MKRISYLLLATLFMTGMAVTAFAHTGPLVNGEPAWNEVDFTSLDTQAPIHNELIGNDPINPKFKGWFFASLTNHSGSAWTGMNITAGVGDLVAIMQGNSFSDEWGISGPSVFSTAGGTINYSNLYWTFDAGGGDIHKAWGAAQQVFTLPVAVGQNVRFKIYTDNSYYANPATSFSIRLTPLVPEPSSVLALSSGLLGLAGVARRKRR